VHGKLVRPINFFGYNVTNRYPDVNMSDDFSTISIAKNSFI